VGLLWLLHRLSERLRERAARTGRTLWVLSFFVLVLHGAYHVVPHWYGEKVGEPTHAPSPYRPAPQVYVPRTHSYTPSSQSYQGP
jgi:hypothetical protein